MEYLDARTVLRLLGEAAGRWMTARFVKRTDGTIRRMTFRTGVKSTGPGLRFDPAAKALRVVWAADALGYRMLPLDAVLEIVSRGCRTYKCICCGREATVPGGDTSLVCVECWYEQRRALDRETA